MSKKFKAIVIDNQNEKFTREIKELSIDALKDGNVLVKIDYSGLNYKDALILNNGGRIVKKYPFIPGIDFSGTVEESKDEKFKKGDRIILTGFRVGEVYFGGFAGYAKVNSSFLVKAPKELSNLQTMMMGTAGFTALLSSFAIKAREELLMGEKVKDVLVTGATGGVGSIAVMVLSKLGYDVTAVTRKNDKSEYLKSIGAKNVINSSDFEKEPRPLDKGLWDCAVDTVGGKILANVLAQTKDSGIVAACGNASDIKLNTTVMPFIIRGVKLWGINSVNTSKKRREFVWSEASKLIDFKKLDKSIKTISLEELLEVYSKMLNGETSGRYIIDLNK